ncbi:hypothetical protein JMM63_02100 [Rhodovulum sulfidophilum]|uniref:DUF6473 family protein n=1 Tax=Rhodovulum sulfidophilum TaxID=35806 RepID=UPI001923AA3F|nr:DUF6473 family protein [Rhodovulum sulfidophilum]MBL3594376.1 hypothetical protein [Rhodovulum sulfidophilum]
MIFDNPGGGSLAYSPCRYGNSKLEFRGPRRPLEQPYCAAVGGTETYGKFVPKPYPALIEEATGLQMVNLGCINAGLDVFLNDASLMDVVAGAQVTIFQALGAHNMSNRFYVVHPRRNDRFLRASAMLKALYPGVDFTEFHFTRHMLSVLKQKSPSSFEIVVAELQMAWQARMRKLAGRVPGDKILLWLPGRPPGYGQPCDGLGEDPLFVTQHMLDTVRSYFTRVVEFEPSPEALARGAEGMVHGEADEAAAASLPGPAVHEELAEVLSGTLRELHAI